MEEMKQMIDDKIQEMKNELMAHLVAENQAMKIENQELKDELMAQNQIMKTQLVAENQAMKIENQELKDELMAQKQEMNHKIQELTDELGNLKHENPIMFHAHLSSGKKFEDGSTIIFDTVVTNVGGAYAPSVGVFLCPVSGYYFFAVSLISITQRARGQLMINDTTKQSGPLTSNSAGFESHPSGMSTQTLIAECQAGSIAYVQAKQYSTYPAADLSAYLPSFSGFLLYEIE